MNYKSEDKTSFLYFVWKRRIWIGYNQPLFYANIEILALWSYFFGVKISYLFNKVLHMVPYHGIRENLVSFMGVLLNKFGSKFYV